MVFLEQLFSNKWLRITIFRRVIQMAQLECLTFFFADYSMEDLPFEVYLTKGQSGLGMSLTGGDSAGMNYA